MKVVRNVFVFLIIGLVQQSLAQKTDIFVSDLNKYFFSSKMFTERDTLDIFKNNIPFHVLHKDSLFFYSLDTDNGKNHYKINGFLVSNDSNVLYFMGGGINATNTNFVHKVFLFNSEMSKIKSILHYNYGNLIAVSVFDYNVQSYAEEIMYLVYLKNRKFELENLNVLNLLDGSIQLELERILKYNGVNETYDKKWDIIELNNTVFNSFYPPDFYGLNK